MWPFFRRVRAISSSHPPRASPAARAALGFSSWQRAIISHAGQSYTLEHGHGDHGDTLRIVTQDLRGTSLLELPLNGKTIAADDGDNGARVLRSAFIKGSPPAVVVHESARAPRKKRGHRVLLLLGDCC